MNRLASRVLKFAAVAVVCGFAAVGFAESAVTVEVTATTELGVPSEYRVGFPALEAATPLYIAYGQKDGGAVQIRWDHYEKVADLAAGATSAVVPVPEGLGVSYSYTRFFVGECPNYTSSAYIDGGDLMAQWDGEDNVGRGQHAESPAYWHNLVRDDDDMELHNVTFGETCANFAGNDNSYGVVADEEDALADLLKDASDVTTKRTIEVVVHFNSDANSIVLKAGDESDGYALGAYSKYSIILASSSSQPMIQCTYKDMTCAISLAWDKMSGINKGLTWLNGQPMVQNGANSWGGNAGTKIYVGKRPTASTNPLNGSIYSIRCYNRLLTEEELRHNWSVDQVRFFGVSPDLRNMSDVLFYSNEVTLNVSVSSSLPGYENRFTTSVSPASEGGVYALGTQVTVTAAMGEGFAGTLDHWEGDVPAGHEKDNPLVLTMSRNRNLRAVFRSEWAYDAQEGSLCDGYWKVRADKTGDNYAISTRVASMDPPVALDLSKPVAGGGAIVEIRDRAFLDDLTVQEVVLPATLTKIGVSAFERAFNLMRVTPFLPESVTNVGENAFNRCYRLKSDLSAGTGTGGEVMLGHAAFHYCQFARAAVGARVKVLPSQLFSNCFSLEEVVLPETLERIEERAFYMDKVPEYGILDLREKMTVTPLLPSTLTYLGHYAFVRAKLAGDLVVPGGVAFDGSHNFSENLPLASATFGEGTEALPDGLFELCAGLKTVRLPKGVTTIGHGAFWRCSALEQVLPEFLPPTVTFVGSEAFRGCSSLGGVLRLGQKHEVSLIHASKLSGHALDHQFNEMSALTDVVFGKGVTAIGRVMFQDSLSLRNVTFTVWPTVASDAKYSSFYFDPGKGCNYTVLFKLPRGDAQAEAFIASAHVKKWADCTEAEVAGFAASHPGERPPIGLTVGSDPMEVLPSDSGVPFLPPNQWVTYAPSVGMQLLFR